MSNRAAKLAEPLVDKLVNQLLLDPKRQFWSQPDANGPVMGDIPRSAPQSGAVLEGIQRVLAAAQGELGAIGHSFSITNEADHVRLEAPPALLLRARTLATDPNSVEGTIASRQEARGYLQDQWKKRTEIQAEPMDGKPAVAFVMPSGPNGSASSRVFHTVEEFLTTDGVKGEDGKDFKITIETAQKPGETRHRVHLTEALLAKAMSYVSPIEGIPVGKPATALSVA